MLRASSFLAAPFCDWYRADHGNNGTSGQPQSVAAALDAIERVVVEEQSFNQDDARGECKQKQQPPCYTC